LKTIDRLIFGCLYRLFPSLIDASIVFRPETLLRWRRRGFRLFWRWKSRRRVGRSALSPDIRSLVRRISRENPLWGAPRIHGELLKLGIEIAQSTVAKYMARRRGPPSQGWKTFTRNHAPEIAAIDLFVVPTIDFKLLYGLAIIRPGRRRLVWTSATANPTSEGLLARSPRLSHGTRHPATSSTIEIVPTASSSERGSGRWASATDQPHLVHPGRTDTPNGSSARSAEDAWTISWPWARPICAGPSAPTPTITIAFVLIWLSTSAPHGHPAQVAGSLTAIPRLGGLHHEYVRMV
jgi:hypothetical protein